MLSLAEALAAGTVVLDGGLSTELERRGHDLSSALWSARLLADNPAAIIGVHRAFLQAGAQVLTTASYQASEPGFARGGLPAGAARELMARSVTLAREAIEREGAPAWVAGSAGPYGALLANGSEYTGDYGPGVGVPELRAFHRDQLAVLAAAGADVLACETVPSLAETRSLVAELDRLGHPAWLCLTTVPGPGGAVLTRRGEPAQEAFALAGASSAVVAVGVNCTDPRFVGDAVRVAARASGKPVVVYPNSGQTWDAAGRVWTGSARSTFDHAQTWVDDGARLVGGCCQVTPAHIRSLAERL